MQLAHVSRCRKFAAAGYVTNLHAYVFEAMIARRAEIETYTRQDVLCLSFRTETETGQGFDGRLANRHEVEPSSYSFLVR
jgi:hypothetical protein